MKRKAKNDNFFREVKLSKLEIKKHGNSCCIRIPVKVMKKKGLTVRKRVRPFLVVYDDSGVVNKCVSLPTTEIKKRGNSSVIFIAQPLMKIHELKVGMNVVLYLFLRDKLFPGEFPDLDEIILVIDGKVSTMKKADYYMFEKWKKRDDKEYRETMKDYL